MAQKGSGRFCNCKSDARTTVGIAASTRSDLLDGSTLQGWRRGVGEEVRELLQEIVVALEEHSHLQDIGLGKCQ